MRIAMIGQKGIPAHAGGVEQHVEMLANQLTRRGHQVIVYCRRSYFKDSIPAAETADSTQESGLSRIFRPSIGTKHLDAITHTAASTIDVLFRGVDLVHYHAIGPAALAPVARLRGLPTVVTVHGLDWQRAKWGGLARQCLRLGERLAARWASQVIVVSEPLKEYFAARYGVNAQFIPNGVVPISLEKPCRIKRWDLQPRRYVLAASRLVPEKGLHYLIQAWQSLDPTLTLVIAGGGGLDTDYENNLRRMAGPNVVFTGNADRELLAELYSHALLFVLPSELEGMSIALLEAMSCRLAVVVSDIPENACVVGDAGFTFRSRDARHLHDVLASLLDHRDLLTEFGSRCQQRAERYQWTNVANELEAVYHSVVSGGRGEKLLDRKPEESQPTTRLDHSIETIASA